MTQRMLSWGGPRINVPDPERFTVNSEGAYTAFSRKGGDHVETALEKRGFRAADRPLLLVDKLP